MKTAISIGDKLTMQYMRTYSNRVASQLVVASTFTPKDATQLGATGSNGFWNNQNPASGQKTDQISRASLPISRKGGHTKRLAYDAMQCNSAKQFRRVVCRRLAWTRLRRDATEQFHRVASSRLVRTRLKTLFRLMRSTMHLLIQLQSTVQSADL